MCWEYLLACRWAPGVPSIQSLINYYYPYVDTPITLSAWLAPFDCLLQLPVAYREGGFGVFKPPRNSEDIGGVLDRISMKNRRLDFLLQFTVFSYGCNLLNKGFF